jgi:DNA-binding winged helix-turn-helix (wHTH) protein
MIKPTPQQRIIAWRLALQRNVNQNELITALWGNDPDGGPFNAKAIIKTQISHLRQRLRTVNILTFHTIGYSVAEQHRSLLLDILADEIARNVHTSEELKQAA